MIAQALAENIGTPIDKSRPKLKNADGSFSTERTITEGPFSNGSFLNIPTIVNGQEMHPDAAIALMERGMNPHVGEFQTLQDAERAAIARSLAIGNMRGGR